MNHLFNTKPHFQTVVDRQRVAQHRLTKDQSTRTQAERSQYERTLQPVPLADVELPHLPMVRMKEDNKHYAVLGELAQMPGTVLLLEIATGQIKVQSSDELELVPPNELG